MIEDFIINSAVGVVLMVVKNPEKRRKFRTALLKIFKTICAGYAGDAEFKCGVTDSR